MMSTAETMARFIKELAENGIDDPDTLATFSQIALVEHCRAHGGVIVDESRHWGES